MDTLKQKDDTVHEVLKRETTSTGMYHLLVSREKLVY